MSAAPVLSGEGARSVIDPAAYADWDNLLDSFDAIRAQTPVVKVVSEDEGLFDPFWLVTSYDDVMRISKDNATFLNNPRTVVFSLTQGIEFAESMTGGSPHLARLEMRILFETLLDRIDMVEMAGEPARSKSTFVGGLKHLPLAITAS